MNKLAIATVASTILNLCMVNSAIAFDSEQQTIVGSGLGIHPYIGVRNGASFLDLNLNGCDYDEDGDDSCTIDDTSVYTINPYIGVQFPISDLIALNTEVEYFWHSDADLDYKTWANGTRHTDEATIELYGGYVSFYATFIPKTWINPYIGGGLGIAHSKTTIKGYYGTDKESNTNFSYHIDIGATLNVTNHVAFDMTLRYADYGKIVENVYTESLELDDIQVLGGIKFTY